MKSKVVPKVVHQELALFARSECQFIKSYSVGAPRYRPGSNGKILEQKIAHEYECEGDGDGCCGNIPVYYTETEYEWRVVWQDDGDSNNKPPVPPPDFERHPWDNRCPVFSSVMGTVTSDWGWRNINGETKFHQGIDIGVPVGTPVQSTSSGEVVWINRTSAGGETGIIIRNGNEIRQYWHVDVDAGLSVGDTVAVGNALGVTANYPAPHLHYARYNPPNGDWTQKSPANSVSPCP